MMPNWTGGWGKGALRGKEENARKETVGLCDLIQCYTHTHKSSSREKGDN